MFNLVGGFPLPLRMRWNPKSLRGYELSRGICKKEKKIFHFFKIHSKHLIAIVLQLVGIFLLFLSKLHLQNFPSLDFF